MNHCCCTEQERHSQNVFNSSVNNWWCYYPLCRIGVCISGTVNLCTWEVITDIEFPLANALPRSLKHLNIPIKIPFLILSKNS